MSADTETQYGTVGGAVVVLTVVDVTRGQWRCTGCRGSSIGTTSAATAREAANAHAATCRALPRD